MIDPEKLAELRKFFQTLVLDANTHGNAYIFIDAFNQVADTLETLWKENAELRKYFQPLVLDLWRENRDLKMFKDIDRDRLAELEAENAELKKQLEHIRFVMGRSGCEVVDRLQALEKLQAENAELKAKIDEREKQMVEQSLAMGRLEAVARAAEVAHLSHICFTFGCPHAPIAGACGHDEKRDMKRLGEALASALKEP